LDRLRGRRLHRVDDGEKTGEAPVDGDEDDGPSLAAKLVGTGAERTGIDPDLAEECGASERHLPAADHARDSLAGMGAELLGSGGRHVAGARARYDRARERMFARRLEPGGQREACSLVDVRSE